MVRRKRDWSSRELPADDVPTGEGEGIKYSARAAVASSSSNLSSSLVREARPVRRSSSISECVWAIFQLGRVASARGFWIYTWRFAIDRPRSSRDWTLDGKRKKEKERKLDRQQSTHRCSRKLFRLKISFVVIERKIFNYWNRLLVSDSNRKIVGFLHIHGEFED